MPLPDKLIVKFSRFQHIEILNIDQRSKREIRSKTKKKKKKNLSHLLPNTFSNYQHLILLQFSFNLRKQELSVSILDTKLIGTTILVAEKNQQ